jgi:hypothetical protein
MCCVAALLSLVLMDVPVDRERVERTTARVMWWVRLAFMRPC